MEIIIHGTKGGYKVLQQTPNAPFSIARDVRRIDRNDGNTVGQTAYSIAFADRGCAFTKYVVVRDIERAAVGNVAFSVYIPGNQKMSGGDIKMLLDDLAGIYCQNYVTEGNLGNRQEDWTFVSALVNQYKNCLRNVSTDDVENCQQGAGEAAYVFYSKNVELQKYFDAPYQEEYSSYRQVFLIEQHYENAPDNPLNALRHDSNSNLTGKIDLENPRYKLKDFYQNGKNGIFIDLWANDRKRSNGDVINRKDTIRIRYSKNKYFIPIEETGKIYDNNIGQYLLIVDGNKITVKNDVELLKVEKCILLEVTDRKGNRISDAEIICKNEFSNAIKPVTDNKIHFEGEELKDRWTVSAKKDNLIAKPVIFIPEDSNLNVSLVLSEYKRVTFQVMGEDGLVLDYNVQIKDKQGNIITSSKGKDLDFYDDFIERSFSITISANNYQPATFNYCPAKDETPKYVKLQKKQFNNSYQGYSNNKKEKRYYLKIDERYGTRSRHGEPICEYAHNYPQFKCDANFGYKFYKWERIDAKYEDYDGYYEAQFKELWWHKISKKVWGCIFLVALLIGGAFVLITQLHNNEEKQDNFFYGNQIQNELSINSDNLDSLNRYKNLWNGKKPEIKETGGFFGFFGKTEKDSTEYKQWEKTGQKIDELIIKAKETNKKQEILSYLSGNELMLDVLTEYRDNTTDNSLKQQIEQCITLRTLLNNGELTKIKSSGYIYSTAQKSLEETMNRITNANKRKVAGAMNETNINTMNLDEIAKFINQKIAEYDNKDSTRGNNVVDEKTQNDADKKRDAISMGSLETEFWNLVCSGNIQKDSYNALLKKYRNKDNQNKDFINFLNKICRNSTEFAKFKNIPKQTRMEATRLTQIDIN